MADRGHQRSPGRNSPARGRGRGTQLSPAPQWPSSPPSRGHSSPPSRRHSKSPSRGNQQDPGTRSAPVQYSGSRSPQMSSGSDNLSSSGSEGEGESAARGSWCDDALQGLLECLPPLLNPMAFLQRTQRRRFRSNRLLFTGDRIHGASSRGRRRSRPDRDPEELMQENMRRAMHASRVDAAMRAHAERLEAIGLPQPAPNARTFTGAFGSQPSPPGPAAPRRDTPAPWLLVEGLQPVEPPVHGLSRNPAQPFEGHPPPQLPAGGSGDLIVTPEVAGILKDLKEHLLDSQGHFIPVNLASAYRAGILNENDQINPTFVGWLRLAGIPCHVKPDGTAYLGHEITAQSHVEAGSSSSPAGGGRGQSPARASGSERDHPVVQLQGLPALAGGMSLSSAQRSADMKAKLESLRKLLLYEGTENFTPEGIADLRRFGVLNEVDQIEPQFLPWLKAAEVPIVSDADQKAYLGVYDGRSARTTGLGKEWAFWNKLAMTSRQGVETRTHFFAAEQLLRLPPPQENIDLGHLSSSGVSKVEGLKNGLIDNASGQLNPQMIAELHRIGIINEDRRILPEFVPWLRAADVPLVHDAERRITRLDSDAARAANYGRASYRATDASGMQERLSRLISGAAQVQSSPAPGPHDQRAEPVVPADPRIQTTLNLMHPVAAEAFDRILRQQNLWADPGQQAVEGAEQVHDGLASPSRADAVAREQEAALFGPDGERNPRPQSPENNPEVHNPGAAARRGIQAADNRLNRVFRDVFSLRGAGPGRGAVAMVPAPPVPILPRGGARAIVQYVEPADLSAENEEAGVQQSSHVPITLLDIDRDIMRMEQAEELEHPGIERDARRGLPEGCSTEDLQTPSYRSPLRKPIVHYRKDPPPEQDVDLVYTREQHPATNRMSTVVRKYMGDGVSGMICEMWPYRTGPLPEDLIDKVLRIRREIAEAPHRIIEHVGRHGGDENARCEHYTNFQQQFEDGCGCWGLRLRNMMRDPRGPNMYKRAVTAVVCKHVREYLPMIDGRPDDWNWSREHNNLFFSWLYHYGEPHAAGRQYNCLLSIGRILEFMHGTGLDYSGIMDKLQGWESTVTAWHEVSSTLQMVEEEMQYSALQESFAMIGEWLEKHPEVSHISYVPVQMMTGWAAAANSAGRLVHLECIVSEYISRQLLLIEQKDCLSYIRLEKREFVLRSLDEINYEIAFTPHMYVISEYEDNPFLQEITTATNMSVEEYFGDGREEGGFEESSFRPPGKENINPDNVF